MSLPKSIVGIIVMFVKNLAHDMSESIRYPPNNKNKDVITADIQNTGYSRPIRDFTKP